MTTNEWKEFREPVILVEDSPLCVRTVILTRPGVTQIIEREHAVPGGIQTGTRLWQCRDGEMDETRQCRVFHEVRTMPAAEPGERPVFDEFTIKRPLPFH